MVVVLFDATRLFMRATGAAPTGIDRVNEAYARWLRSHPGVELVPVCTWDGAVAGVSLRVFDAILSHRKRQVSSGSRAWSALVSALGTVPAMGAVLRAKPVGSPLLASASARISVAARYVAARLRALVNRRPIPASQGAAYLNVSHYGLEQPGLMRRLGALGVRPMVMIHDLIPIEHPEYCSPIASVWHRRRMEAVLDHATLILANSNSTAEEIAAYAQRRGSSPPPICVAPLGLEPHFTDTSDETLRARPYFVCVGTIEPRKNLTFLLTLWRRLAERRGAATPVLILVGQRGWENESVIDHLDRSPPIQQFVHEVCGLADWELARLIAGARALLSPSFSEGFNLPVAEAQALGTPVIASDIAVHRELARDARLIDPLDGPAWLAAIEATADHGRSTRRSRPTSWEAHFAAVGEAMGLEGDERPGASLASRRLVT